MPEYLSVKEYAVKYGLDVGNIRRLIYSDRISAVRIGSQWCIPADAPRPEDRRVKSGKYRNWRKRPEEL